MAKTPKSQLSILVPTVEEVPRISDAERDALRLSLEKARADIAAGHYDVVTPATLRQEFESILRDKRDASRSQKPTPRRKSR